MIEGKPTRDATAARFQQLKAMGFDPIHDKAKKLEYGQVFDAMIERLRDYEQEHGDGGNTRSFGFTSFVD